MYNSGSFRNPYSLYYSGDRGRQQRTVPVTQSQQQQQQQPQPQPSQVQKDLRAASLQQKEQQQQDAKAPCPQHPLQDNEKDKETKPQLTKQPSRAQAFTWERKPSEPAPAKPPALLEKAASEKKKEEVASAFALASSKADSSSSSNTTRLGNITMAEDEGNSKSENDKMSMAMVPVPVKPNEGGGGGVTNKAIAATSTATSHGSGNLQAAIREDMNNMVRKLALADTGDAGGASLAGPPRVITLAGDNRGAIMEVTPGNGGGGGLGLGLQQRQQPRGQTQSDDQRHDVTSTGSGVTAYVNSNVQASNNSILYNSTCPHRDPGVKLALPRASPPSPSPWKKNAAASTSPSSDPKP